MNPLFPQLPADLTGLTDEELNAALEAHRAVAQRIRDRDAELLEGRDPNEVVSQFQDAVVQINAMTTEIEARAAAEAETAQVLDSLADEALGPVEAVAEADTETGDGDDTETTTDDAGDGDDETSSDDTASAEVETDVVAEAEAATAEAAAEPEAVAAAAPPRRMRLPRATTHQPPVAEEDEGRRATLVASSGIEGVREGMELDTVQAAEAIIQKMRRKGSLPPGFRDEVLVASLNVPYPADRTLTEDPEHNDRIMREVLSPQALAASGGICAVPVPIYDLPTFGTTARPVRGSMPGFAAPRGAITYPTPLSIADVGDGIGIVTAAQDEAGGSLGTKNCMVLECDPFQTCEIAAVYACVEWGNFGARTWPERVASFMDLVGVAHARLAEGYLLDAIEAGSTQVTAADATYGYGAASNLLAQIIVAAAAQRSRHRMEDSPQAIRFLGPAWVQDLIAVDLINGQFDRFERTRAQIPALLRAYGVEPSFYLDSATGEGMIFGAQADGALLNFPDQVKWYIWPEGTWVYLDGGTLDLGVVRDSVLNATNDYQIFFENFENACKLGLESLAVLSDVCPNGATGGPDTLIACAS